jgi:hypothetical protein
MDFLNLREEGMVFYQVFRLRDFKEIDIRYLKANL